MKKIVLILLSIITAIGFCACNKKQEKINSNETKTSSVENSSKVDVSSKKQIKVDKSQYNVGDNSVPVMKTTPLLTQKVNAGGKGFSVKIFGESQISANQIEIYLGEESKPVQIFPLQKTNSTLSLDFGYEMVDLNFDGEQDFRIVSAQGADALNNTFYFNYIWDNELGKFYSDADLDKFANIKVDSTAKTLQFKQMTSAFDGQMGHLQFIDGQMTIVENTIQKFDTAKNTFHIIKKALKDGVVETVSETDTATATIS